MHGCCEDVRRSNGWRFLFLADVVALRGTRTMAFKTTRRPGRLDVQRKRAMYVAAHQRAYAWAEKALGYRKAGKIAQAKAAAQKAQHWLKKAIELEAKIGGTSQKRRHS